MAAISGMLGTKPELSPSIASIVREDRSGLCPSVADMAVPRSLIVPVQSRLCTIIKMAAKKIIVSQSTLKPVQPDYRI